MVSEIGNIDVFQITILKQPSTFICASKANKVTKYRQINSKTQAPISIKLVEATKKKKETATSFIF